MNGRTVNMVSNVLLFYVVQYSRIRCCDRSVGNNKYKTTAMVE